MLSQDTVLGIIRHVLTSAGGALVTDGVLNASQLDDGVGALVVLIGIAWSVWNKFQHRAALTAAKNGG